MGTELGRRDARIVNVSISRVAQVLALLLLAGVGGWNLAVVGSASAADKVWVCKYVGKPGVTSA